MSDNLVEIIVSAKNLAKPAMEEASADAQGLGGVIGKMGVVAGAALAGVAVTAVKMASDFQASIVRLNTSAGESQANLDTVSKGILDMAGKVGVSAQDLATAMYQVESAGFHGAAGLTVLQAAAQGAKAEGADTTTVVQALTDVLTDYHQPASKASDITSQMIAAVATGKTTLQDFSGAFASIVPAASAAGISFTDVSAALAAMTNHGFTADRASQNLAQALRSMLNPTNQMQGAFDEFGVSTTVLKQKLADPNGLTDAMEYLSNAALKAGKEGTPAFAAALKELMGTAPGANAALATVGANFSATSAAITSIGGATADAQGNVKGFAEVQKTLGQQVAQLTAGFESLMIEIGQRLIPVITTLVGWLAQHNSVILDALKALGAFVAILTIYTTAAKAAAIATTAWSIATGELDVAEALSPVGLITVAVVGLAAAVYELVTHWQQAWGDIKKWAADAWNFIYGGLTKYVLPFIGPAGWLVLGIIEVAKNWKEIWGELVTWVTGLWSTLVGAWNSTGGVAITFIANQVSWLVGQVSQVLNLLVQLWDVTGGKIVSLVSENWGTIQSIVIGAWNIVMDFLRPALDTLKSIFSIAWAVISGIFTIAWNLIKSIVSGAWNTLVTITQIGFNVVKGIIQVTWDVIKVIFQTFFDAIKGILQIFIDLFSGKWSKLWDDTKKTAISLWNDITGDIGQALDTIIGTIEKIWDNIIKYLGGLPGRALSALAGIFDPIGNAAQSAYNTVVTWLEKMLNYVTSVPSRVGNVASQLINDINPFAHGGIVGAATGGARGSLTMVGEHGPELVRLPYGSTVSSNPDTVSALQGAGGAGGGVLQLEWVGGSGGDEFMTWLRKNIRARYGSDANSVQKALGQSF
jgi:TP901 family phage tail tape measure protein